jgi:DNA-binding transcriptional MerR regulator
MVTTKPTLRIGELAAATGVSRDTLRHYERKGVLKKAARTSGGYRVYPLDAVERVALVRRALVVGFSLDELARVFAERDRGGTPCRSVRKLVGVRLHELEGQIAELVELRANLHRMLDEWDRTLRDTPQDAQARLLDGLLDGDGPVIHGSGPAGARPERAIARRRSGTK